MLIIWMGRLCFWAILVWAVFAPGPFSYGPFLHVGRSGMGRFVRDDLVSGPTSPESATTNTEFTVDRCNDKVQISSFATLLCSTWMSFNLIHIGFSYR